VAPLPQLRGRRHLLWLRAVAARSGSVAVTTCCDSVAAVVPREPLLSAIAVLPAARDALDERRLLGTAVSDLNTLADA
jgi:hypothetical protein